MKLTLFCDGASRGNPGVASIGVVIFDSQKTKLGEISKFLGKATNNQAEYFALLFALQKSLELGGDEIEAFLDSKLVVEQMNGRWKVKDVEMKKFVEKTHALLEKFKAWKISHIPREKNSEADSLANLALDLRGYKKSKFIHHH